MDKSFVVKIFNDNLEVKFGTGFLINENTILTCSHCIQGLQNEIKYEMNEKIFSSQTIHNNNGDDIAILRCQDKHSVTIPKFLKYCKTEEDIRAYGYDYRTEAHYDHGVLLKKKGIISQIPSKKLILFGDTKIFNGYSGGPVVNDFDQIIGMIRLATGNSDQSVAIKSDFLIDYCSKNSIDVEIGLTEIEVLNENLKNKLKESTDEYAYFERKIFDDDTNLLNFNDLFSKIRANNLNIIKGKGGVGKSVLVQLLATKMCDEADNNALIIFCRGKLWSSSEFINEIGRVGRLQRFFFASHLNRELNFVQLETIFNDDKIVKFIFFDGLNEIAKSNDRFDILNFFQHDLSTKRNFFFCVSTRNISDEIRAAWTEYSLEGISDNGLEDVLKSEFGKSLQDYDDLQIEYLKIPFFLDKVIKSKDDVIESYSSFINKHILKNIDSSKLDNAQNLLAKFCYDSYQSELNKFELICPEETNEQLRNNGLLKEVLLPVKSKEDSKHIYRLEHQLVNEYFVAHYLAKRPDKWNRKMLNMITFDNRVSYQILQMILEQVDNEDLGDQFLTEVYDWNLYAPLHCIKYVKGKSTQDFAKFMILLLSEKFFEVLNHSRKNVLRYLTPDDDNSLFEQYGISGYSSEIIKELIKGELDEERKREIMSNIFQANVNLFEHELYQSYYEKFSNVENQLDEGRINEITSFSSLLGWSTSNVLRRLPLDSYIELQLRTILYSSVEKEKFVIRWRVIHALGKGMEKASIEALFHVVESDEEQWCVYGAFRSLIEIGLLSTDTERLNLILNRIKDHITKDNLKPFILKEILNCLNNSVCQEKKSVVLAFLNDIRELEPLEPIKGLFSKIYRTHESR